MGSAGRATCGGRMRSRQFRRFGTAFDKSRAPSLPKIRHVVIIFQENRSTDNLFNGLPGADTVRVGLTTGGGHVRLKPVGLAEPYDLDHAHSGFVTEYANGKLDGFNRENSNCIGATVCIPRNRRAYGYVPRSQVKPYFAMAMQYAFGDRMFQSNQGPSFPAHQYILSGTSAVTTGSSLLAAENPYHPNGGSAGRLRLPGRLARAADRPGRTSRAGGPFRASIASRSWNCSTARG